MIPKTLQNKEFRFIKVMKNGKMAVEKKWTSDKNYLFDEDELGKHILSGGNYGVCGGFGGLLILDFDTESAYDSVSSILPPTFTVLSATKKLPHLYYIVDTDNPPSTSFNDLDGNRLLDVQGRGKMVVGPNSKIGENAYTIKRSFPITKVNYSTLMRTLEGVFPRIVEEGKKFKSLPNYKFLPDIRGRIDAVCDRIKMFDLLRYYGITQTKNYFYDTPFGVSVGRKCLHVSPTGELWYDFNTKQGGNIFTFVKLKERCNFMDALKKLEELK